jgi:branched-subunit amino acid aminotransferase/4-amino-4-deoxychorismate lyase
VTTSGCGCKICKAELGDYTNGLINDGVTPNDVLKILQNKGLTVSEKLLKKHLSAFGIPYPENEDDLIECEPVTVELNKIDFSEYAFDDTNPEEIIAFLQKVNLKIYLNQSRIALQMQQNVIDGKSPDIPSDTFKNLAVAWQILEKSTALNIRVNQQEAIKIVESMGLTIQSPIYLPNNQNVQTNTQSETN